MFCSDQCFSLHRRQVYRQSDRKQNSHVSDRKQTPHVSVPRDIQKPRLSVKPDYLLKMTTREKQRRLVPAQREVEVSIPKIFVDMAFTGHYSRISVPRNRVR